MGTFRLNWRGRLASVALWALLATAAALEEYDEVPELEVTSYQDDNSIDTGPAPSQQGSDLALAKDLLLYRLIKSLQGDEHPQPKYRRHLSPEFQEPNHIVTHIEDMSEKDAVVKRIADVSRGTGVNIGFKSLDQMYRPQQKWKIKKGKAMGSQMVCYFKLCAFRSPI